jgi:hypothetical protein
MIDSCQIEEGIRSYSKKVEKAMNFTCAPILLIGFNRPDFLKAQIDAIRGASPSKIYLAVDGPRRNVAGEQDLCKSVQDCVKEIDWTCQIHTRFRAENLGCKYGVSDAITWFFENEESGIVLEDDCRPTLDFLRFASEMLERYRDDERVGLVAGFNHFNLQSDISTSYHFSAHFDIWGWASWRRVWREYDVEMVKISNKLDDIIDCAKITPYYRKVYKKFARAVVGGLSTWDIQFSFLALSKGWLSIVPKMRLVSNAGLKDVRATHTGGYVYWGKDWSRTGTIGFPLVHPTHIHVDEHADYLRERMEGALLPRGLTWVGAKIPAIASLMTLIGQGIERVMPFLMRL